MAQTAKRLDVFGDLTAECLALSDLSPEMKIAFDTVGQPVVRRRPGGFEGLFRIIVEQQVSVPSAQSILKRIGSELDMGDAACVEATGVEGLRALGLSLPKAGYVVGLARLLREGLFSFEAIEALDDEAASASLQSIKGVGPWTASIYLLFCEGRVDIWPPSDVALKGAFNAARRALTEKSHGISKKPDSTNASVFLDQRTLDGMAVNWAPLRGVAAHILWTYYAHVKNRAPI